MPTPTLIPVDSLIKVEFVSFPLLAWQVFLVGAVIATLAWLYLKLTAEEQERTPSPNVTYPSIYISRTGSIERTNGVLPISLLPSDDEEDIEEEIDNEEDDDYGFDTCSYCGASNDIDARSCYACGAPRKKAFVKQ